MCLNIEVILPTVKKFLLLYPLRNGCIIIIVWTLLRSTFCVVFYSTALLEVFTTKNFPLGTFLNVPKSEPSQFYLIFYSYNVLLINEFVLLLFLIHLGMGVCQESPCILRQYLIARTITWFIEMLFLPILCIVHKPLIGWYLGILIFIVLEFYAFVVVYSFYSILTEDDIDQEEK